jgi:hypothetical protein
MSDSIYTEDALEFIASNFRSLPEKPQNTFLRYAENTDPSNLSIFSAVISECFDKLPERVRNELLFKLASNPDANNIPGIIVENFDSLPEDIRNLLFELVKDPSAAINLVFALSHLISEPCALPEDVRNRLLIELANSHVAYYDRTYEIFAVIVIYNYTKVPVIVQNLLFEIIKRSSHRAFE